MNGSIYKWQYRYFDKEFCLQFAMLNQQHLDHSENCKNFCFNDSFDVSQFLVILKLLLIIRYSS